ncbi:MAG: alpha-amylase/4-alpha-glucanotransferase domain-containing protein [Vulcanimicrobiaceae bacterium]
MSRIALLFGVHAHQPVGNFTHVVDDARLRCYRPFLEALDRHPRICFTLHCSGWLLETLWERFPQDITTLRRMVERGQVEIVGGGDTEPILATIPQIDRRAQLRALGDRIQRHFGMRPVGAWLAERVWQSSVVPALVAEGIGYVAVDDYHFRCAGISSEALDGYYTTEEGGQRLDLFPISEALRYAIPFAPAHDVVAAIEARPAGSAAVYFDDIEKFGIWPQTYEWVYERGWLEEFLTRLEASTQIETLPYHLYRERHPARGIAYLPTTAYAEMNAWTLPPEGARRYDQLVARACAEGTLQADKPLLRGGIWPNFFMRYDESNRMHKRMLGLSKRLHGLDVPALERHELTTLLHRSQANDAYWHGLFGGLYLPHLRRAVHANLIALEARMDRIEARPPVERMDVDFDGMPEIVLHDARMQVILRPHHGAAACEIALYPFAHDLADSLSRRPEAYDDAMRAGAGQTPEPAEGIASIHDRTAFRTAISEEDLRIDERPRNCFLEWWCPDGSQSMVPLEYEEAAQEAIGCSFQHRDPSVAIRKRYELRDGTLGVTYRVAAPGGSLRVRSDLSLVAVDAPAAAVWVLGGDASAQLLDGGLRVRFAGELRAVWFDDAQLGARVRLDYDPPAMVAITPHDTVSQSETGFERVLQSVTLDCRWSLNPTGGTYTIRLSAEPRE